MVAGVGRTTSSAARCSAAHPRRRRDVQRHADRVPRRRPTSATRSSAPGSPTTRRAGAPPGRRAGRGAPAGPRRPAAGRGRPRPVLGGVRPSRRLLRAGPRSRGTWPPAASSPPRRAPRGDLAGGPPSTGFTLAAAPVAAPCSTCSPTPAPPRPPELGIALSSHAMSPDRNEHGIGTPIAPATIAAHDARRRPTRARDRPHRAGAAVVLELADLPRRRRRRRPASPPPRRRSPAGPQRVDIDLTGARSPGRQDGAAALVALPRRLRRPARRPALPDRRGAPARTRCWPRTPSTLTTRRRR